MTRPALIFEFAVLFVLLPLAFRLLPFRLPPLPVLWIATLYCYLMLRRDSSFPASQLWSLRAGVNQLPSILAIFAAISLVIVLGVYRLAPDLAFNLVRSRPALWALIMVLYPVLSVYPQGIVYRAFLMHRYTGLLTSFGMSDSTRAMLLIFLSAAAFGFMHIVFRNPLAVAMTFGGGLLFAWRYQASESLGISSLEHALYGCLLFTVGLGQYFYLGRVKTH